MLYTRLEHYQGLSACAGLLAAGLVCWKRRATIANERRTSTARKGLSRWGVRTACLWLASSLIRECAT